MLISELLEETSIPVEVTPAREGREALDHLSNSDGGVNGSIPDLVILDLNLPKVHGFDILARVKSSPTLEGIAVVVMTGSPRKMR